MEHTGASYLVKKSTKDHRLIEGYGSTVSFLNRPTLHVLTRARYSMKRNPKHCTAGIRGHYRPACLSAGTGAAAEKDILLEEMQQRVANNLQIIAHPLIRRAPSSEETRLHCRMRITVLSVAAVQQHLHSTREGAIEIGKYISKLCKTWQIDDRQADLAGSHADASTIVSPAASALVDRNEW